MVTGYGNSDLAMGRCSRCRGEVPMIWLREIGTRDDPYYLCEACWEERRARMAALVQPARGNR